MRIKEKLIFKSLKIIFLKIKKNKIYKSKKKKKNLILF